MSDVVGRAELEAIVTFNVSQVNKSVDQVAQNLDQRLGQAAQQVGGKVQGALSKAFSGVGKAADAALGTVSALARVAGVALGGLAAQALATGISFNKLQQQSRGALQAILGGQSGIEDTAQALEAGKKATDELLDSVNKLNDTSPFSRQSFLQLTQTLAGFGVEAQKIPGVLDAIQQAVAATGGGEAELLGLGQAFARIASSGKITGDIIQTFASRGIDLLSVLAKEANRAGSSISEFAGKSGAEIRDAISKGSLDATRSIEALTSALTKDFAGATENVRKNFGGALDTFKSRLRNIGGDFTKAFIDPVQGGATVDALNNISSALTVLRTALQPIAGPLLQKLADLLRFVTAGIRDFAAQFGKSAKGFKEFVDGSNTASNALQGVLDKIKGFLPVLAFFGAKFGGTFLTQIPVVGQFLAGLNPVVLAIGALVAVTPELRTAFADVARTLGPIVKDLIPVFSQLLVQIGAALGPVISAIARALVPAFVAFATALGQIVPRLGPLVAAIGQLLLNLTPLVTLIANGLVGAFNVLVPIIEKAITVITNLVTTVSQINFADIGQSLISSFAPGLSAILPLLDQLGTSFETLDVKGIVAGLQELAGKLGILEPILVALTVAATAAGAALLVYKAAALASTIAAAAQAAAFVVTTFATEGLTAGLVALEIATGVVISPFVAVAAIVAAVAAAFVVLYLKVQPVRDAVDGLIDKIQEFLPSMDTLITILKVAVAVAIAPLIIQFKLLVAIFKLIFPTIQALANLVGGVLLTAFNGLRPVLGGIIAIFKALAPIIQLVRDNFRLFLPALIPLIPAVVAVGAAIGAVIVVFKLLPPLINLIATIVNGILRAAFVALGVALNGVASIIDGVAGVLRAFFALINGGISIITTVVGAFSNLGNIAGSIISAFSNLGPVRAFLNVLTSVKDAIVGFGPVQAIIDGIGTAFSAAGKIIDGIINKLSKVKGFLNKLSFGKLFKDTGDEADKAAKKTEILPQELKKIADAAAAAVPPIRTLATVQKELSAASDSLRTSLEDASKRIDPLLSAAEGVKSAQKGVADAQAAAADASRRVAELDKERQKVLRDTIKPAREIELAERSLQRARADLANTDREIIKTQKELNDFRAFGRAEQEAALERDLERAKIGANQARRSEQELLAEINKEKEKGNQESAVEINLAGLTLSQARAKLAAARATLAAQQQGKQVTDDEGKTAKTAEQIEEEKRLARLDTLDAEQRARDAERAFNGFREEADAKEAELQQGLIDLQTQKIEQQESINEKQNALNDLRKGETTLAKELKRIDDQIADAKRAQADAARRVTDAIKASRDAELALNLESAKFTGNLARQAELEKQRFELRAAGLKLEPAVRAEFDKTLASIQGQIDKVKELNGELSRRQQLASAALTLQQQGLGGGTGDTNTLLLAQSIQQLAEAIGSEGAVKQAALLAKVTGKPVATTFAEGGVAQHVNSLSGLINRPTHVTVGEGYKHELVLPLTKPNRIWQLVSQHLPKYPGAMAAVSKGVGMSQPAPVGLVAPMMAPSPSYSRSGAIPFVRKGEGPMTQNQADKMIGLLESLNENGGPSIHIDAPIEVSQKYNEEMLAKAIEKEVRKIIGRIR